MSIAKKLGFAISPLAVLSVCLVIFCYQSIKQIQKQIPNIAEFAINSTELVYRANTAFYRQNRFYEELVFMHDPDMLAKAEEASQEILHLSEKLRDTDDIRPEMKNMIDSYLQKHRKYTTSAALIYKKMSEDEKYLENPENARNVKKLGEEKTELETTLLSFSDAIRNEVSQKITSINISATQGNKIKAAVSFAIITVSVLIIFILIRRGIIASVSRVISGLNESARQITSSSGQILSACQTMAQGASEQAASSQEITSTMEEIASVTGKNADHAKQADSMMNALKQAVESANRSMTELSVSIGEICNAGEQTSGIVKSIEKIAFQTNLLALNAAVEAARAGEFGAGFAVVAGEVRNLAVQAARDSKNTSDLLSDIARKVEDGTKLVTETREAFARVVETSVKVTSLMGEISSASVEQANRIRQVSGAVAESDRVVQQSAANTEESASASEEMNLQAEQMKQFVDELVLLVSGNKAHTQQA